MELRIGGKLGLTMPRSARALALGASVALSVGAAGSASGGQSGHGHDAGDDFVAYGGAETVSHSHGGSGDHHHLRVDPGGADDKIDGKTTLEQTIVGDDPATGFRFLRFGPGEPRVVREELAAAKPGRESRRVTLAYLGHLTDFQVSDEESPARVEFFDTTANPPLPSAFNAAHRPQEALVAHGADAAIRQMNDFTSASPHASRGQTRTAWPKGADRAGANAQALSGVRMSAALMTGDLADNQQFNETEWVIQLLEGGMVDPNSGIADFSSCLAGPPPGRLADPRNYAGVQDKRNFPLGFTGLVNQYYDPQSPGGIYAGWPRYPGLLDRAQEPFPAAGLRYADGEPVASYVVFGNHDGLAQGNQKAIAPFEAVGTGCVKPLVAVPNLPTLGLEPGQLPELVELDSGSVMLVPPDPKRRYVDKAQFKQVAGSGAQPDDHGFGFVDPVEQAASRGAAGYYAFDLKPGLRMIGLDTLCEGGVTGPSASGNIDDPQFRWLRAELAAAQTAGKLIVLFGHHPIRSLTCDVADETPPACTTNDGHGHDINPGCDRDPRDSSPIHLGDDLTALLQDHPNVIAYIGGHTHEQALNEFAPPPGSEGKGSFWGIETASLVDWPPQSRLLEVVDNCDGTLSILGTVIDTKAPAAAPAGDDPATPADEAAIAAMDLADFASIARTLSYNDHQAGPAAGGQGTAETRNVELLVDDPRPARSAGCDATRDAPSPGPGSGDGGAGGGPGGGGPGGGDNNGHQPKPGKGSGPNSKRADRNGPCARVKRGNRRDNRIKGRKGGDRISGKRGDDRISGRNGRDCLSGGAGNDRIGGGKGDDRIRGGKGKDLLVGGGGRDRIQGGKGADDVRGGKGADRLQGGPGDDVIRAVDGKPDKINCGKGRDKVIVDSRDRAGRTCERIRFASASGKRKPKG